MVIVSPPRRRPASPATPSETPPSTPALAPGPPTARGRATCHRIIEAAAALMYERGVAGTSLDDVRAATSTSKSQLYHYFADKSALVCAVLEWQQEAVLAGQQPYLGDFGTLAELRAWRDHLVTVNSGLVAYGGCPIGSLATEVATADVVARRVSAEAFEAWRAQLSQGIRRIVAAGELPPEANADELALGLLAAVQGGLLLTQATQSSRPLAVALDHALAAVEAVRVA